MVISVIQLKSKCNLGFLLKVVKLSRCNERFVRYLRGELALQ